jgi:predicted TIM-barrel fold metal-dependent hydrolase
MIDAHVYCLPPRLRQSNVMLPKSEAIIQETIYYHAEGPMALSKASPDAIIDSMDQAGIARTVLIAFPWADSTLCRENNDFVLEQVTVNDRFMAVCSVQPASLDALDEARRVLHAGAIGIKINPVWQGFCLDDAHVNNLAAVVLQNNVFLMLHVDQPYKQSPASPAYLFDLAVRQPGLKILASHLGGLLGLSCLHPPVAQKLENVWYDTAVSSTLEMVRWYRQAGLTNKLVMGSDFPFNHSHSQKQVVRGLRNLELGHDVLTDIFETNFLRLTGFIK